MCSRPPASQRRQVGHERHFVSFRILSSILYLKLDLNNNVEADGLERGPSQSDRAERLPHQVL